MKRYPAKYRGKLIFSSTKDLRHHTSQEATQVQILRHPVLLNSHQVWEWIRVNFAFLCQEWKGKRVKKTERLSLFSHFPLGSWFVRNRIQLLRLPWSWLPWLWLPASSVTQAACSLTLHPAFYPWEQECLLAFGKLTQLPDPNEKLCLLNNAETCWQQALGAWKLDACSVMISSWVPRPQTP